MLKKMLILLLFMALPYKAAAEINLIRDAEIEDTLKKYARPIFSAAGLNSEAVKIYIVNDSGINAFVAGGQNLFLNTGLILECKNSAMLIGVMAHEVGHIAGGHIIKMSTKAEEVSIESILTTVLGAAVTVAGLPEAGIAVIAGGQHLAMRNFLSFSREQEVEADQYAINFLKKTNQPLKGLLNVLELLRRNQNLSYGNLDPFSVSHPLSDTRISHIRAQAGEQDISAMGADHYKEVHDRMLAKLSGFLEKPDYTFAKYTGNSVPDIYARAIAYYKKPDLKKALAEVDKLLAKHPSDPFFNELKGQFLSESGRSKEALVYYKKADSLFPGSYLLKFELGKLYVAQNDLDSALDNFTKASKIEANNGAVWRQMAIIYGKKNNDPMANLMLAEEAKILDKKAEAKSYAKKAADTLPKKSPALQRANDIISDIKFQEAKDG